MAKLSAFLATIVKYIIGSMMAVMSVVVLIQVIFRYLIKAPLPWSEELARYLMVWIGFLGASLGIYTRAHVGVKIFLNYMPDKMARIMLIIGQVGILLFLLALTRYGYQVAVFNFRQVTPVMRIPMAYLYFAAPVGGFFMFMQTLNQIWINIKNFNRELNFKREEDF